MSQKSSQLQLNQMKKTTLAVAIKQAIRQVGIQHEEQNIFKLLKESFNTKFPAFRNQNNQTSSLKGMIFNNYQYPIGDDDRQQYYTGLIYEGKLTGSKLIDNSVVDKKPLILLQAYSKNEDPKKRSGSTKPTKKQKIQGTPKKKVKKN